MRLHQLHDNSDTEYVQRVAKLRPLLEALRVLSEDIGNVEGVEINVAEHGHMATSRFGQVRHITLFLFQHHLATAVLQLNSATTIHSLVNRSRRDMS